MLVSELVDSDSATRNSQPIRQVTTLPLAKDCCVVNLLLTRSTWLAFDPVTADVVRNLKVQ